jgi:hypothetical protein
LIDSPEFSQRLLGISVSETVEPDQPRRRWRQAVALSIPLLAVLLFSMLVSSDAGDAWPTPYWVLVSRSVLVFSILVYGVALIPGVAVVAVGAVWPRLWAAWAIVPIFTVGCAGIVLVTGRIEMSVGAGGAAVIYAVIYCAVAGVRWR